MAGPKPGSKARNRKHRIDRADLLEKSSLEVITAMARANEPKTAIAKHFGIDVATFDNWMVTEPEIESAYLRGYTFNDFLVEGALLKRAMGFSYTEQVRERVTVGYDSEGNAIKKLRITKETRKYVPPDVRACEYYLNNRMSKRWSSKPLVSISTENAQMQIQSVAEIISNPVPSRRRDFDEEDDDE